MCYPAPPTIAFVPGSFHTPAHFSLMTKALQNEDIPSIAISLPTCGPNAEQFDHKDDIEAICKVLLDLVELQKKDVLFVCHSYGGIPASQSVTGLEKSKRASKGQEGGIIGIVFICSLLVPEGERMAGGKPIEEGLPSHFEYDGSVLRCERDSGDVFYNDLDPSERGQWVDILTPQSGKAFTFPTSGTCWDLDIRKAYIMTKADLVVPYYAQEAMVGRVRRPDDQWQLITMEGEVGHSPFLSRVEQLVGILKGLF
ncbi:alpha/beta-hydrolase [Aulographum hederae CBS 113979]|uniref:Alpha/beta-hydrolase n=1 Tax=Aulographum hederae CBS 113979 TaxID=1176131 RepID=A0A6G1GTK0_9PEZI|nr:alpha/beta-hydrolase [Aulographum hederae CBS 113979]